MRAWLRGTVLLSSVVLCTCALLAQETAPLPQPANTLSLDVTVTSKSGDSVKGLTASEFVVTDNKNQQPITSFHEVDGAQVPTEVVIVLDAINTPFNRVQFGRDQIDQFLAANQGHLTYPTSVAVLMDSGAQVVPQFTKDGNSLRDALSHLSIGLRSLTRDQGFYGAQDRFQLSLDSLDRLITGVGSQPGRKVLVWVSPGWPLLSGPGVELSENQSRRIFQQAVALLTTMRENHVTLDVVNPFGAAGDVRILSYYESFLGGARDVNHVDLGDLGLQTMSIQTGGQVMNGNNDIVAMLRHCYAQNDTVYQISIPESPGERENEYHQIKLKLTQSGLTPRTTTIYYARPTFTSLGSQTIPTVTKTH